VTKKSICILPTEPLARSGVGVLAGRWARSLRLADWEVRLHRPPTPDHIDHTLLRVVTRAQRTGATVIVVGLPADKYQAQAVVTTLGSASERAVLLWDRAGHAPDRSAEGLSGLDRLAECWVLNPLFRATLKHFVPNAKVRVVGLAIPDVFFESRLPSASRRPRAVFLGRFSATKGARFLAERWAEEVWPATGVPLTLAGRGMSDGIDERAIAHLERCNPGIQTVRLMSEKERARFLRNAAVAVFPARHDYLPQALAETIAVGTAVVATDIPGHRPLAPPATVSNVLRPDLANLTEAVSDVLDRPEAALQRALTGRNLVREVHSVAATRQELSRILTA